MATTLLNILYSILSFFIGLFPTYTGYPAAVTSAITYFSGKVYGYNCILPISDILTISLIEVAIAAGYLLFRFLAWVFHWKQGV